MTGYIEMLLLKAMSASAAREESRRRRNTGGQPVVCSVCRTYGGTMYRIGDRYICRDCRRKEEQNR